MSKAGMFAVQALAIADQLQLAQDRSDVTKRRVVRNLIEGSVKIMKQHASSATIRKREVDSLMPPVAEDGSPAPSPTPKYSRGSTTEGDRMLAILKGK